VQTAVDGGYKYFFKFRWAFNTDDGRVFARAQRAGAWVGAPPQAISFSQRFIEGPSETDELAGFDMKQFALLHEVLHAVDRIRSYSDTRAFQDAFDKSLDGVDRQTCQKIRNDFVDLGNAGRDAEGWNRMRREIRALKLGSPGRTLPSAITCLMTRDRFMEAFAEYGSFWFFDPDAAKTFPLPMAAWFQRTYPIR
jgi:hypothetical protein